MQEPNQLGWQVTPKCKFNIVETSQQDDSHQPMTYSVFPTDLKVRSIILFRQLGGAYAPNKPNTYIHKYLN